jgi:serine/threonine protein kinase/WD40 repeat protein
VAPARTRKKLKIGWVFLISIPPWGVENHHPLRGPTMAVKSLDEEALFHAARRIASADDRSQFLRHACGADAGLAERVRVLLAMHEQAPAEPDERGQQTRQYEPVDERAGSRVGPYTLREQIGEGGFGLVFVAEQQEPVRRKVALKVIKPGMDTRAVVARFEAERQALALMDHPNIAKVLDAGATDSGRPYFVMELVKGMPITEYADAHHLSPRHRLGLFVQVCQAVQHAHQKGIIHRDIKPSNVLVTVIDGVAIPKVIDFGVAKAVGQQLTDKTVYTRFAAMVGTPLYMAPEQAELSGVDVDTRADIYALGVLLYELLTGTTPFDRERFQKAAFDEIRRIIKEEEPPRPSTRLTSLGETLTATAARRGTEPGKLAGVIRGELDWIVMRCLEKDRGRRYETATGLAKDVQRHLAGDAVEACPPTLGYRLRKAYRKNRGAVLTAASFAAILLVATGVSVAFGVMANRAGADARRERDEANAARSDLESERQATLRLNYSATMRHADTAWRERRFAATRDSLDKAQHDLRGWEWHYLNHLCKDGAEGKLTGVLGEVVLNALYSPNGAWIATISRSNPGANAWNLDSKYWIQVWDTNTRIMYTILDGFKEGRAVEFSPDSRQLLVTYWDGVQVWDVETRKLQKTIPAIPTTRIMWTSYCPDGERIAIVFNNRDNSGGSELALLNVKTGNMIWQNPLVNEFFFKPAVSPDGRWLLVPTETREKTDNTRPAKSGTIYDTETGAELLEIASPEGSWHTAQFSPSGTSFVSSSLDGTGVIRGIRREGKRPVPEGTPVYLQGQRPGRVRFGFNSDGTRIVLSSADGTARICDTKSGRELSVLRGHESWVYSAVFSPDDQRVLTAGNDGTVRLWSANAPDQNIEIQCDARVITARSNRAGTRILAIGWSSETRSYTTIRAWDVASGNALPYTLQGTDFSISPDDRWIACVLPRKDDPRERSNKIGFFDAETGKPFKVCEMTELEVDATAAGSLDFDKDGTQLMVKLQGRRCVLVWDLKTGKKTELGDPGRINGDSWGGGGFSLDGTKIWVREPGVTSKTVQGIAIYDAKTHERLITLETGNIVFDRGSSYRFSDDGSQFLGVSFNRDSRSEGRCLVWDVGTGKLVLSFPIDRDYTYDAQISPDAKRIITVGLDGANVLDAATGNVLLRIPGGVSRMWVSFSPTGNKVVIAEDAQVRVLDGTPLPEPKK